MGVNELLCSLLSCVFMNSSIYSLDGKLRGMVVRDVEIYSSLLFSEKFPTKRPTYLGRYTF